MTSAVTANAATITQPAATTAPTVAPPGDVPGAAATSSQLTALVQALAQLTNALAGLVNALQGAQLVGSSAVAASATTMPSSVPGAATLASPSNADPLSGFNVNGDQSVRPALASALARIDSTRVGSQLMSRVRGHGLNIAIVDDATYAQRVGTEHSKDSVGVFMVGSGIQPQVLVRASAVAESGSVEKLTGVLAHELTHAAQHYAGESPATYQQAVGTQLSPTNLTTGDVLMHESGAELVDTAIGAELKDPARFHEIGATKLPQLMQLNWDNVASVSGYNPQHLTLPVAVSPTAVAIVRGGLGA